MSGRVMHHWDFPNLFLGCTSSYWTPWFSITPRPPNAAVDDLATWPSVLRRHRRHRRQGKSHGFDAWTAEDLGSDLWTAAGGIAHWVRWISQPRVIYGGYPHWYPGCVVVSYHHHIPVMVDWSQLSTIPAIGGNIILVSIIIPLSQVYPQQNTLNHYCAILISLLSQYETRGYHHFHKHPNSR